MSPISEWIKYAVIADFAKKLKEKEEKKNEKTLQLGRTALQKLIYLLQELYQVDCGYEFKFYTYGPFSSEILDNIEILSAYNAVKVKEKSYSHGYAGYVIEPSSECETLLETASDFRTKHRKKIDSLVEKFGDGTAEDLELYATIVWVDRDLRKDAPDKEEIADVVEGLKPKFSKKEILAGIEFLAKNHFLLSPNAA